MLEVTHIIFFWGADGNASPDLMPSKKGKRLKVSTTKSPNKTQSTSRHQSSGSVNMTDSNDDDFEILQCKFYSYICLVLESIVYTLLFRS
jgi:hypothetical protein